MQVGIGAVILKGDVCQHAPLFVTAGVVDYLLAKIAARCFSLLCPVQTQNSDHSGQFLLYCLIQERSTHRAEIRLRWQVRANSTSSCNLFIQHKNSYFNLFCHEILKHAVVKEESVGRGCSNTYYRSLAKWEKKERDKPGNVWRHT